MSFSVFKHVGEGCISVRHLTSRLQKDQTAVIPSLSIRDKTVRNCPGSPI